MRKPFTTAAVSIAILGWASGAGANPPAAPAEHGDGHHETKSDHHADKDGTDHQPKGEEHHDAPHHDPKTPH